MTNKNRKGGTTMVNRAKPRTKTAQPSGRAAPRRAPKMKVIESGQAEQEAPIKATGNESGGERSAKSTIARQKEREAYRYGGIPIGSDPRE